ncbi:MAG: tRNA lysidine(34) synthetase TilS [Gemmatimonadales bacterium]
MADADSVAAVRSRFAAALAALRLEPGSLLLAVSGGADSMALLDLAAATTGGRTLLVAHVDHGIAPESAEIAERVAVAAAGHGLQTLVERLELGADASETRAREGRHAALRRTRERCGARYVLLAHHADDQIETVLMRLARGSGPAGLAAMEPLADPLARPLLGFRRTELVAYCLARGLGWWDDPANRDLRHDRVWFRERLLPLLDQRLPDGREAVLRSVAALAEDRRAWDELLGELEGLDFRAEPGAVSVAAAQLKGYSSSLGRMVLRSLGRRVGASLGPNRIELIETLLAKGHTGRGLDLGKGCRAELGADRLRLFRVVEHPLSEARLEGEAGTLEWGAWRIEWAPASAPSAIERVGLRTWVASGSPVAVRPWRAGDRIRPIGGAGSRLVVRCMQDRKIQRSERPFWPVMTTPEGIIWVPDVCRSDTAVPPTGTNATRIDARRA